MKDTDYVENEEKINEQIPIALFALNVLINYTFDCR